MGNRSRYRGEEEHHATEFICECLRSFGIGEAPANKFALTFAAAATSPWVDTESSVKLVNAVQARSEAARRHVKLDHARKVALDRCCVLPAFMATAHFDVSQAAIRFRSVPESQGVRPRRSTATSNCIAHEFCYLRLGLWRAQYS